MVSEYYHAPTLFLTEEVSSPMYQAIQNKRYATIKYLLQDRSLVNVPLQSTGPVAGYTALHHASMMHDSHLVNLFVKDYNANVNIVADDGAQPIHLACLINNSESTRILVEAGANVNAEISRDLYLKYTKASKWSDDFGDKMTILIFAIVHACFHIVDTLIENNAHFEIKRPTKFNKTLLMFILENDAWPGEIVKRELQDRKFLNARDDDGFSAIHYVLHPKKYNGFRYNGMLLNGWLGLLQGFVINSLIECGADISATVNGDPDTLLLNMAAYRSASSILARLLPHCDYITKSKALYYATLPLGDPQSSLCIDPNRSEKDQLKLLRIQRKESTEIILKDLVNRRTFGLPIPKEEKQLMDKLIATDTDIRTIVNDYEKNFINGTLKNNKVILSDSESITLYDFISRCLDNRKIKLLVKNKRLIPAVRESYIAMSDYTYFNKKILYRIRKASTRVSLLNKLKKIEQLRKAVPLSYELVLDLIEYLDNYDLETFINAFYL